MQRLHVPTLAAALLLSCSSAAAAQCRVCDDRTPRAGGELLSVSGNAVLGGLSAGVQAHLRGRAFGTAFVRGAAGGALVYAGKRVAVERFDGAGLLGRELAAVGGSVSRNAADGRGPLSRVMLPLGPTRLYLGDGPARLRLDAAAIGAAAYAATRPGARLAPGESLSAGMLVFRREGSSQEVGYEGLQMAGTVLLRHPPPEDSATDLESYARSGGHERVHAIQYDQTFLLWGAPLEDRLSSRTRGLRRWADLGVNAVFLPVLGVVTPYSARPWELEAYFLSRTRPGSSVYQE
jgi:hypothetical protein